MSVKNRKVALITGANGSVGLGIARRLLTDHRDDYTLVLACRMAYRAEVAKYQLREEYPGARVETIAFDIGSAMEVLEAAEEFKRRYNQLDLFFCNAGLLSASGLNWPKIFRLLFTDMKGLLERADATVQRTGEFNEDGMGLVFACNVFGHYILIRALEELLQKSGEGRVIWTSSITSKHEEFSLDDWQGVYCPYPYESSKWLCDIIAVQINEHFKQKRLKITSFTTHPGVVASSIGNLPRYITESRKLLHYIVRWCGVSSQTITGWHGALSNIYVAFHLPLSDLETNVRYGSYIRWNGKGFVDRQEIEGFDLKEAETVLERIEALRLQTIQRYNAQNA
ncbi:hypothetical protein BZG36_03996 [Bifiguratus adelaidae]|uniref:3beta-hydroxysteroid 3-dehydrogenase n=1 Tax=Bifiguratus adelaidae TaxID=1938954 RepID=A0A261Y1N9_9FUNG|nr:hypothetical protein BZG36_03996 [Bifiguratus adelaidae]